jgi:hypothetical protein
VAQKLKAENRVLPANLSRRVTVTPREWRTLLRLGKTFGGNRQGRFTFV